MQRGKHYFGKVQLREVGATSKVHAFIWSTIKYVVRFDKKGTPKEDLAKAMDYIGFAMGMKDKRLLDSFFKDKQLARLFIETNEFSDKQKDILRVLFSETFNYNKLNMLLSDIKHLY